MGRYTGISYEEKFSEKPYRAIWRHQGKNYIIGRFKSEEEAYKAQQRFINRKKQEIDRVNNGMINLKGRKHFSCK